jgi:hypothetical protein
MDRSVISVKYLTIIMEMPFFYIEAVSFNSEALSLGKNIQCQ